MDHMAIADRRQLRRKLTFWRVIAIVALVAAIGYLFQSLVGSSGDGSRDQIARIEIGGMILDDKDQLERLERIAKADHVKGLVVSISSPGGTTYGGERLYKAIRAVAEKKPVVSDIRTLAASAGYMVATAGDHIVAGDTSITGSIGVIFQYPQVKELMDKIGVSMEEIKSSPMKAEPSPFHEPPQEAKAMIQTMILDSYDWFVDLVAERRKLPREEVLKLANGSIFTGRQALEVKLIDELGGDEAIRAYFKSRQVVDDLPIVTWETQDQSLFSRLLIGKIAQITGLSGILPLDGAGAFDTNKLFLDGLVSVWQVKAL
jgi:protease-4